MSWLPWAFHHGSQAAQVKFKHHSPRVTSAACGEMHGTADRDRGGLGSINPHPLWFTATWELFHSAHFPPVFSLACGIFGVLGNEDVPTFHTDYVFSIVFREVYILP